MKQEQGNKFSPIYFDIFDLNLSNPISTLEKEMQTEQQITQYKKDISLTSRTEAQVVFSKHQNHLVNGMGIVYLHKPANLSFNTQAFCVPTSRVQCLKTYLVKFT